MSIVMVEKLFKYKVLVQQLAINKAEAFKFIINLVMIFRYKLHIHQNYMFKIVHSYSILHYSRNLGDIYHSSDL